MRIIVTVQAFDDEIEGAGSVVWGYHHEEQVPVEVADSVDFIAVLRGEREPTEDELKAVEEANHRNSGRLLDELMKRIEEAGGSITSQAAAGLPIRSGPGAS